MTYIRARLEDIVAGLITATVGAFIIIEASTYKLGSLYNMGPGYFPTMIGSFMVLLAIFMIITAQPSTSTQTFGADQLRGTGFVAAAFIAFAYTVESFGMLASVFLVVFLSALGNRNTSIKTALILAVGTAVVSTLIFRVGLGLQIKAF